MAWRPPRPRNSSGKATTRTSSTALETGCASQTSGYGRSPESACLTGKRVDQPRIQQVPPQNGCEKERQQNGFLGNRFIQIECEARGSRSQQFEHRNGSRLAPQIAAVQQHGNEQHGHHQVLSEGSIHAVKVVEFLADQQHQAKGREQDQHKACIKLLGGKTGKLVSPEFQEFQCDEYIQKEPCNVDVKLGGGRRVQERKNELPGEVGAQGKQGHSIGLVLEAPPNN